MSRGGMYRRDNGEEIIWPSQMVWKETDAEELVWALGELLDILMDKNIITPQDAIDVIPYAENGFTANPPTEREL